MKCKNCPYVQEELSYKCINDYDTERKMIRSCSCDKVGGRISNFGYCYDETVDIPYHIQSNKYNHKSKRERDIKYKSKLVRLSKYPGYPSPCVYKSEIWIKGIGWTENPKPYYQRLYRGKHSKNVSAKY